MRAGAPDRIELRGLRLNATHGALEAERLHPQPFELDMDIVVDTAAAARSDELSDTADYSAALEAASRVMSGAPRNLLETLAHDVAVAVMEDPLVVSVTVALRKLQPPVPQELESAGVRVTLSR